MDEEKTEQATPRSRERARERGQVAKSRELTGSFVLLVGFLTLFLVMNVWGNLAVGLFQDVFGNLQVRAVNQESIPLITKYILTSIFSFMWPVFLATSLMAILINLVQTKGLISAEPIKPKLSNINPISGLKRMFSTRGFVELIKAILKITLVTLVAVGYIKSNLPEIVQANTLEPTAYFPIFGQHALRLGLWIIGVMIILSLLDLIYQYYQFEKDLMLTRTEAKEEYKQMEGDPLVKSRMRQRQRQIALTAMLREVPKADMIITNPTHIAIALKYEPDMPAPQVVAKGKGAIAERIINLANEFHVHIHRDPPLARSLYRMVEVGDMIPYEFYVAIAEVLAYIYKTKKKYRKHRSRMAAAS
ncbi:MAG: flagellar biosynthesis protein FlhB [bacterium]|nr:flagellar biosynthesis protein FlhB [bacterium]